MKEVENMEMIIGKIIRKGNSNKKCKIYVDGKYIEDCVIDWATIPVDTKLLVSLDGKHWLKRYFAKYEDGKVYCFRSGSTSFSVDEENDILAWKYAKLYQE